MTDAALHQQRFLAAGWSVWWKRAWLIAFGAAFAAYEASHLNKVLPKGWVMESSRSDWANHGIAGLNHHTPLLVGWYNGSREAIGVADDLGWYVYSALLGHWLHVSDSLVIARWSYIVLFSLLLLVAPLVWFELFDSMLVGIAIPIAIHTEFGFMANSDTYWLNGWSVLLLLPIVALAWKRKWGRTSVAMLVGVCLAASWVSSVRTQGGLPIFIAALSVVALKQRGGLPQLATAAALAAAYVAIFPLGFIPIEHTRDAAVHAPLTKLYPVQHAPWHNMYIGLGYLQNPYGITWLDEVGFIKANQLDPGVSPNTKRYVRDVRTLYLRMLEHHPGFVFRGYVEKSKVVGVYSYDEWKKPLALLPLMLLFGSRRRISRALLLLALPAALLNFLPPVLTVPYTQYVVAFKTTAGFYWLIALAWLVSALAVDLPNVARSGRLRELWRDRTRLTTSMRSRQTVAVSLCVVGALFAALYQPASSEGEARVADVTAAPWGPESALVPASAISGKVVGSWTFSRALGRGWSRVGETSITRAPGGQSGITVSTPLGASSHALSGPLVHLKPGSYRLVAFGDVISGGVELDAFDAERNHSLATGHYWAGQQFGGEAMVAPFHLTAPTTVRPVLANWHAGPGNSTWILLSVSVVPAGH